MTLSTIHRLARAAAFLLALGFAGGAVAHDWAELDPTAALADADVALTITAAFLDDPQTLTAPAEPLDLTGWPVELAWWTRVAARIEASGTEGRQRRIGLIEEVAPSWTEGQPADGEDHLRWRMSMGELIAHAAARTVTDEAVAAAEARLADAATSARDADLASWIVVLPRLTDDERTDLAPAFERVDALIERGLP